MRHFKATMFVNARGEFCSASQTDQAGKRNIVRRTRFGNNVIEVGDNKYIQRKYAQPRIREAQFLAACRDVFGV